MRRNRGIHIAMAVSLAVVAACSDGGDEEASGGTNVQCVEDSQMDVYSEGVVHTDAPGYKGPLGNPPQYAVNPPSGGDHLAGASAPGVYAGLNIVPDGNLVHSLEHGYVILWYRSDAPLPEVTLVRDMGQKYNRDVLVVERADMPSPVAATAWKQRLLCDHADAERLGEFIEKARNKAPEKVPH
ncbi:MAG TPA: DUF3105 domain-containing protein [Acidimicrobiales bacterium]|jgi:hypothetical protein